MNRRQLKKKRTFKLQIYKVSQKLPPKSCEVLIFFKFNHATRVSYSSKHKAFNCNDSDIMPQHVVYPHFWAYPPKL